jgi:prevent-host-death family protein
MKRVPLSEIKDDLSRNLREAEMQESVVTRRGKPAGVLIGLESEDDRFDYRLEHDPRFLRRIQQAPGHRARLDDLEQNSRLSTAPAKDVAPSAPSPRPPVA